MAALKRKFCIRHNSSTTLVGGNPKQYFPPNVDTEVAPGVDDAETKRVAESIVADYNNVSANGTKMEIVEYVEVGPGVTIVEDAEVIE